MKTRITMGSFLMLSLLGSGSVGAAGYPWKDHAPPYDFLFGNGIDSHQQTRLQKDGSLFGYFYINFTGDVTTDGYPVATHANCNTAPDCTVGWILRGEPGSATFLYHVMPEHPVWLVDRADIPQPGAYAHFHWVGEGMPMPDETWDGYFLELQAVDTFCFVHHKRTSTGTTCLENGGIVVMPGIDIATHGNIVSSSPFGASEGM